MRKNFRKNVCIIPQNHPTGASMTINSMTINVMQTINVMHRGGDSRLFVPTRH